MPGNIALWLLQRHGFWVFARSAAGLSRPAPMFASIASFPRPDRKTPMLMWALIANCVGQSLQRQSGQSVPQGAHRFSCECSRNGSAFCFPMREPCHAQTSIAVGCAFTCELQTLILRYIYGRLHYYPCRNRWPNSLKLNDRHSRKKGWEFESTPMSHLHKCSNSIAMVRCH